VLAVRDWRSLREEADDVLKTDLGPAIWINLNPINPPAPGTRSRRRRVRLRRIVALIALLLCGVKPVMAQSIERNLPPPPAASAPAITAPEAAPTDQDRTPIGPALRAVALLGATTPLKTAVADGIDLSGAPRLAGDRNVFSRFLGQPISRKLIAEVQSQVVRQYRAKGFPFVSVSTPEQEISSGVLQVRVVEFHLGAKAAVGASPRDAAYIASRIRARPGEPIDADQLSQDLDWLNRFPFRRVEPLITPGEDFGASDLRLQTSRSRPWSAYVGYANSGSPLTGLDRYFAGGQAALPGLHDAIASYQFTGSDNALFEQSRLFDLAAQPQYISHAGRIVIPTLPRQDIEASISYVRSNQPVQVFLNRQTTVEAAIAYRSALSNISSRLPGEVAVGVEAKSQDSQTLFGDYEILHQAFEVFQITLAYAQQETDSYGRTSGELTVRLSPGSIDHRNTAGAFSSYSQGRFDAANYVYVSGDLSRSTRLPSLWGRSGFSVVSALIGQYSATPLPLTEQSGLGGAGLVRGYTLDDGAFDTALVSRNEFRAPPFAILSTTGHLIDQLSPYALLDAGFGKDQRTGTVVSAISTGFGADYQLAAHMSASVDIAWPLHRAGATRQGDARLESRFTFAF
jgi:hemolysin activation/secretion protein